MKNNPSKLWLADSIGNPNAFSKPVNVIKHKRHSPQGVRIDINGLQLSDNVIFTIADDAYFNKVSVLINSVNKFAPDCNMVKVSVNESYIGTQGKAIELGLHEINLPHKAIDHWTKPYKNGDLEFITELCTAIKPSMFEWCFSKGAKRVLYIDPDCKLYGNIDYLFEQLVDNECILFPHFLDVSAIDNARSPDMWDKQHDALVLRVGVYNCGMIGFSITKNTHNLIKWWGQRTLYESECTTENFTFTDQSWGSLMPGLAKTKIIRLPEYNTAWWNDHERNITYDNGHKINSKPLKVYHFSGYDTNKPLLFSRHHRDKIPKQCRRLFLDYSKTITSANDVNVCSYGYYNHTSGVGKTAQEVSDLLESFGVNLSRNTLGLAKNKSCHQDSNVSLWFANADTIENDISTHTDSNNKDYKIAYWLWELDDPPDYVDRSMKYIDELWVPSTFVARAFAKKFNKDIVIVPSFSYEYLYEPQVTPNNDKTTFLFTYDTRSSWERKNPYGLINAFQQAFHPDEAKLIIKVLNLNETPFHAQKLNSLVGLHDIEIIDELMDKKSYMDMLKNTDVYVSLHRSEGLGKTILEAMSYGIPVITTAYGGHMDITTNKNSVLIPFDMVKIEDDVKILGHAVYKAGNQWADPSINDTAMAMRRLHMDTEFRTTIGQAAREDIWRLLNPTLWANLLITRLRKAQNG